MLTTLLQKLEGAAACLKQHKKVLFFALFIIVGLGVWFALAHPAFAGEVGPKPPAVNNPDAFSLQNVKEILASIMLEIATLFLKVALFFLTFILQISSYNGYLNATAVNVGWVMVRDITNMFFVVFLLLIAFGTILGIEQYEWKKLIVKFVLSAVLVNFSRLICGLFIDASQVVMTTFVNGIAATAGGNLINAFNLSKITKLYSNADPAALAPGIFTASVAAVVFAGMVMMVLAIFVTMLLARVIRLWVLIVLSPLAFVLSVVPLTQKWAGQWWTEMGDDLVTGPVLLFFIWLSFVTVGSGNINDELASDPNVPEIAKIKNTDADKLGDQRIGIGDAMGWNDIANFAIAIGMLMAGAQVAQSIGGSSGSALTRVTDFGKKVATIASGVAAGQWLYEHGVPHAKKAAKYAALAPLAGVYYGLGGDVARKQVENYAKSKIAAYKARRLAAFTPEEKRQAVWKRNDQGQYVDENGWVVDEANRVQERNSDGSLRYEFVREKQVVYATDPKKLVDETNEKGQLIDEEGKRVERGEGDDKDSVYILDDFGRRVGDGHGGFRKSHNAIRKVAARIAAGENEYLQDEKGNYIDEKGNIVAPENKVKAKYKQLRDNKGKAVLAEGKIAMENEDDIRARNGLFWRWVGGKQKALISSDKILKKTEDDLKVREDIAKSQTGGVPTGFFWGNNHGVDAEDRVRQGRLAGEKKRSAAKTKEFTAYGEESTLGNARFKDGAYQTDKGNLANQIAEHEVKAAAAESRVKAITAEAKKKSTEKNKIALQAKIRADLNVKALESETKKLEAKQAIDLAVKEQDVLKDIRRAVEAGKQEHTEAEKMKLLQKQKEREYLTGTHHGRHEIEEEADIEFEMKEADSYIKNVKDEIQGELLRHGAKDINEVLKQAKKDGKKLTEEELQEKLKGKSAAARSLYAQELSGYYTGNVELEKQKLVDEASNAVMLDKKGVTEQASAIKKGLAKGLEKFQGMEKEQAANLAAKNIKHILHQKKKLAKEGKSLDAQQEADLMANYSFLAKNAWADDGLARIVNLMKQDLDRELSGDLSEEEKEEAKEFRRVFTEEFKWGEMSADGKNLEIVNRSGGDRQNDVVRLMTYGGDAELTQAEGAVLEFQRSMKNGTVQGVEKAELGFSGSAQGLAAQMQSIMASSGTTVDTADWVEMAKQMGMTGKKAAQELKNFAHGFLKGASDTKEAANKFVEKVRSYSAQAEYVTGTNEMGLATTHIDDVGHVKYDQKDDIAHGLLWDDARDFVLGDYRKLATDKRMLYKLHAYMRMNENTGTASSWDPKALAETFLNANTELDLKRQDGRNIKVNSKLAADEAVRLLEGALLVGDTGSELSKGTYKHIENPKDRERMVAIDIARDFAVALRNGPQALLYSLGKNAGLSYEDSMSGKLNIKLPKGDGSGELVPIQNLEQLMEWIQNINGDQATIEKQNAEFKVDLKDEYRSFDDFNLKGFERNIRERLQACLRSGSGKGGSGGGAELAKVKEEVEKATKAAEAAAAAAAAKPKDKALAKKAKAAAKAAEVAMAKLSKAGSTGAAPPLEEDEGSSS